MIAELRTFLAVVRCGTFAGAGDSIGLTQSAVSSQMKRLEEHFGCSFFDRTGRSSELNATGKLMVPRVEALLRQFEALAQDDETHTPHVRLSVGAIATAQLSILVPAFARLLQQGEPLHLHIVPGMSIELMDQLDSGALDAALIVRPPFGIYPQLLWQPLLYEPYVLLAPAAWGGPSWEALLAERPWIRYARHSFGGRMVDRFLRKRQMKPHEVAELDDLDSLVALVAEEVGVAIAPAAMTLLPLPASVRMWSLGEHTFYREVGWLQQRHPKEPAVMARLLQEMQQQVEALNAAAPGAS
jgi:DNA-binding transcriptional LysR family regulator